MIDRIKISKEFPSPSGNIWLGAEATVIEGQTAIEEGLKAIETLNELYLKMGGTVVDYSQLPVIKIPERFAITKKEADIEFDLIKHQLDEFEFREDAQAFIDTTDWRYAVEVKSLINIKPLRNEKK